MYVYIHIKERPYLIYSATLILVTVGLLHKSPYLDKQNIWH